MEKPGVQVQRHHFLLRPPREGAPDRDQAVVVGAQATVRIAVTKSELEELFEKYRHIVGKM